MAHLYNYSLLVIFFVGVVIVLLACEIGWRLGARNEGHGVGGNVSALEQSLLGLLALMVGFSFLMALTRFEARRDAVLNEANAIGTTALRARLLPAPYDAEALKSLRDYVQLRLDLTQRVASASDVKAAIGRSNEIQETLWRNAVALAAKDTGMVPTGL